MLKKSVLTILCLTVAWTASAADPDSFGRSMKFRDFVTAKSFRAWAPGGPACDPATANCYTINGGRVAYETQNAGSISLPANSVNSLLCAVINDTTSYQLRNSTAAPTTGSIQVTYILTIESPALNDPSLINPVTGAAFNGVIQTRHVGTFVSNTLAPNAQSGTTLTHSFGAACSPNLLSRQTLRTTYGLSNTVAQRVLRGPLTVRVGYRVTGTRAIYIQLYPTMRLLSD